VHELVRFEQETPGALDEGAPLGRQDHALSTSLEQAYSERLFHLGELRTERRLRDVATRGGAMKRELVCYGDNVLELAERERMGTRGHGFSR
jgi:hypothetical protein